MSNDIEQLERFLRNNAPPDFNSELHQAQLRDRILTGLSARRTHTRSRWKIAALLLGLLCMVAAAMEVTRIAIQTNRVRFEGRDREGSYHFSTEIITTDQDGNVHVSNRSHGNIHSGNRDLDAAGIEQLRRDFEQIESLRQADVRELTGVIDVAVNGIFSHRTFAFSYVLPDGRTETIGESDPDTYRTSSTDQPALTQEQIDSARQQGQREIDKIIETEFQGQVHRTLICRYVLPNGNEVIIGEGDSSLPATFLSPEQLEEMWRLVRLNHGTFISTVQTQMFGTTFTFQKYSYKLPDGSVVINSEGLPQGAKRSLTNLDWAELRNLMAAYAGEALPEYSETIRDIQFTFSPVRYILSDGTEVIFSQGTR